MERNSSVKLPTHGLPKWGGKNQTNVFVVFSCVKSIIGFYVTLALPNSRNNVSTGTTVGWKIACANLSCCVLKSMDFTWCSWNALHQMWCLTRTHLRGRFARKHSQNLTIAHVCDVQLQNELSVGNTFILRTHEVPYSRAVVQHVRSIVDLECPFKGDKIVIKPPDWVVMLAEPNPQPEGVV